MKNNLNLSSSPPFQFPKQLLNQIAECSQDGEYVLFYRDSKGEIVPYISVNNHTNLMGVMGAITTIATTTLQASASNLSENVLDILTNTEDAEWTEDDED